MSNPLSMFRKHQYIFLVVFGVMLMVAFIVLPPLDDYLRSRRGPGSAANPVVVSWKGGQLRAAELERLREMHRVAVSYLFAIVQETQRREGTPRGVRQGQFGQILDPGIPSTMSDENLVHTHLLAAKGEAMGMVVSDQAIIEFLEQLSDETVDGTVRATIFNDNLGNRYSEQQLLNQLRVELLAQRVRSMAEAGLYVAPYGTVPPLQAWDYFKRLNRRVNIEAVALNVEDYVDRVKNPPEVQLQALYEEGKNRFSFPESPEPGFHQRRKAAFQFIKVDFNDFLEEEKAKIKITDEEIEKHYEENKAVRYKALDLPDVKLDSDTDPGEGDEKPAAKDPDGDAAPAPPNGEPAPAPPSDEPAKTDDPVKKAASNTANDKSPAESKPEQPKPKPDEPKPANPKPAVPKTKSGPAEPKPPEPKPATEAPAPSADPATPADPPAPAPPTSPAPSGEAELPAVAREFFVSTQAEENQPPVESPPAAARDPAAPADDKPDAPEAADPKPKKPAALQERPADPKPADPKLADPKPGDPKTTESKPETSTTPETQPTKKPAEDPASSTQDLTTAPPAEAEEPPKLRPLDDKLRQEIRDELTESQARQPAQERVDKALAELRSRVTKLGRAKRKEMRAAHPDDDDIQPSGPIDVDELAGKHGLTVERIPLVDSIEVAVKKKDPTEKPVTDTAGDEPPGDGLSDDKPADDKPADEPKYELAEAFNMQFTSWPPTRENFTDIAFAENVRRYSPSTIGGAQDVQFLYWKTDGKEPYMPGFVEARSDVVDAWKRIEARKIAENEARNWKDEIAKSEQTLEQKFADTEQVVILPDAFSWMTTGFNPSGAGTPALSDVVGVENAGQDFMKVVFSLKPGEVGVAMNMPRSKVYVFRLVSDSPPVDLLKQLFLTSGDSPEVQYIAYIESISLLREWYSNLESELGVSWNIDTGGAT